METRVVMETSSQSVENQQKSKLSFFEKVKKVTIFVLDKQYKKIFIALVFFVALALLFSLGYMTDFAHPDVDFIVVGMIQSDFLDRMQSAANQLFIQGVVLAVILFVALNFKFRVFGKVRLAAIIVRIILTLVLIIFTIALLVNSISLNNQFNNEIKEFCTKDNFFYIDPPTGIVFTLAFIFVPLSLIVSLLHLGALAYQLYLYDIVKLFKRRA